MSPRKSEKGTNSLSVDSPRIQFVTLCCQFVAPFERMTETESFENKIAERSNAISKNNNIAEVLLFFGSELVIHGKESRCTLQSA